MIYMQQNSQQGGDLYHNHILAYTVRLCLDPDKKIKTMIGTNAEHSIVKVYVHMTYIIIYTTQ